MIALIETRLGVDNADAIAAVDGVDCLYLGHVDLSVDLGVPGRNTTIRDCWMRHMRLPRHAARHGKIFIWDLGAPGELGRNGAARGSHHHVRIGHWYSCAKPVTAIGC